MSELLNDRYQLGEVIGSGGMGTVHRAVDTRLGRTVAVKILRDGMLADSLTRTRLKNEALLAASVHHPNVAQIFDFEEAAGTGDGLTFIVMQFIEGRTVSQVLREHGPMPPDQVMSVVAQIADGLHAVHQIGVVHRDLKPANIMLTPSGRAVLVDFGIAHASESEPLTDTGTIIGTTEYLSPEQAAGRQATPRSDLYSLGVVASQCLTGTSPFRRDSHVATALAHLNDDLPAFPASVPLPVQELIASLAAKRSEQRPASAADVASAARSMDAVPHVDVPSTRGESVADVSPKTRVASNQVGAATGRRRRPRAAYAAVGIGAALVVAFGVTQMGGDGAPVVPNVVGLDSKTATQRVRDAGLVALPRTIDLVGATAGEVVRQNPAPGRDPEADTVTISVASGKVQVFADSVLGQTYVKAAAALEKLGFVVSRTSVTQATDVGEVVALDKSGRLSEGTTIVLSIATAPAVTGGDGTTSAPTTSTGSSPAPAPSSNGNGNGKNQAKGKGKGKGKSK